MPAPVSSMGFFAHDTDAHFQAWGTEFHTLLSNAGLTQTADTGQVNTATMTRPALNVAAGYEIWRFNDTLQSTAPIFFKIEYGTNGGLATIPEIWFTIGTGSNGSGTITGILTARTLAMISAGAVTIISTTVQYLSQACYNTTYGTFFVNFKVSSIAGGINMLMLSISRTVDAAGLPTATGMVVLYAAVLNQSSASNIGSLQYNFITGYSATSTLSSVGVHGCDVPFAITSTIISGQAQLFRYYQVMPDVLPMVAFHAGVISEIPVGTTFQISPFGTPITYLMLSTFNAKFTLENVAYGLAVIYQ